ncbi:MAG: phosphoribosylformylglycinamidine cyclo-ligase [Candidatus Omnitrophica bacterium]|nr:phosphoribosylformylglycinamidine cyclo-ligase [Candidatus Omnitrophota bacterium]
MSKTTYKSAGVSIDKGEKFARQISLDVKNAVSAFGGGFEFGKFTKGMKNPVLVSSADGVGTKLLIAQKLGIHNTVGIDLVAMNVNDIICFGARPLFFLDYIGVGKVDLKILSQVMSGIKKALKECDCALVGGETAEMPDMYKPSEYDLAGFCVGILDKSKAIDGRKIKEGDIVLGISSSGIHSNGYSLVRKVLGDSGIKKYAKEVMAPTRLYVRPVLSLLADKKIKVKAVAHVTGGAFYTKITKVLPGGFGMRINKNSWDIPDIFEVIKNKGNISEKEMYKVFNMGIGMTVVVDKASVKAALYRLNKFFPTSIIGSIEKNSNKMTLV